MSRHSADFQGWLERVHPEDRERLARALETFLASPARRTRVTYRLRSGDGVYRPVEERLVVERDGDGAAVRLVSMVQPRTARPEGPRHEPGAGAPSDARASTQRQRAQREERLRLRAQVEKLEGRVEKLEGQARTLQALDRISERLAKAERIDRETLEDLVAGEDDLDEEGSRFLVEVVERLVRAARPAPDEADEADGGPEPDEDHRVLVERSPDILTMLDGDRRIRVLSPAVERLLGHDPADLVGERALDLVHPADRQDVEAALESAASDPDQAQPVEHRLRHSDGTWRLFESTGRRLPVEPGPSWSVVSSRDVTVQRGIENELRHEWKMEAVARVAAAVGREFHDLLKVIRERTRVLEAFFEGSKVPEEFEEIDEAATAAALLVRRLLALGDEAVRGVGPLDLTEAVHGLEPLLAGTAGEAVELEIRVPRGPLTIRAGAVQIEQVVLDLVTNAVQAMPDGGRVTLEARNARPEDLPAQVRHPDQWAVLRVDDTGRGVPEPLRDRIFEPFYTTREGATGLGLATVRRVVSGLGGFVDVVEAPGGGTRFTVCFPRTTEEPAPEVVSEEPPVFPAGRTILVVDSDPASRSLVERVLGDEGYRVLEAQDGVAALTLLEAYDGPLDLLLTAETMPNVAGSELAMRVLATHPDAGVLYLVDADASADAGSSKGPAPTVRRDTLSQALLPAVRDALAGPGRADDGVPVLPRN